MFSDVASPKAFIVAALVLRRENDVWLVVISPPSTLRSKSTSKLFLTLVVPVDAPKVSKVAALNAFTVAAFVFAILNVDVLTVKSPPSILMSPSTSRLPRTLAPLVVV
jgi:hypothetical protein